MKPGRALSSCCGGWADEKRAGPVVGHRSVAARTTGAAAKEASGSKAHAIEEAMAGPGFGSVFRTGWFMATAHTNGKQGGRKRGLVSDQQRARRRRDMCVFIRHEVQLTDKA